MRRLFLIISLCTATLQAYCQTPEEIYPSSIKSFESITDGVSFKCDKGTIVFSFYTSNIIHFTYYPSEKQGSSANSPILPSTNIVNPKLTESKGIIKIKSSELEIRINKTNCAVEYLDNKGKIILAGKSLSLNPIPGKNTYNLNVSFEAPKDENYYGLGQLQGEWLNHRGLKINLSKDSIPDQSAINGMPFMVTNKNYGFIFDNTSKIAVTPGIENKTEWNANSGDKVSYFVIYSSTMDGIYAGYLALTGAAPIPSRATFGYNQGRQRFKSQNEVLKIAQKYRDKKYPCDNLLIDRQTWKFAGDMDWEPKLWPNPKTMNKNLAEKHFNSFISCNINFVKESKNFAIADKNGYFIKQDDGAILYSNSKEQPGALIDFTNANAAKWYWTKVKENYEEKGFNGWWLEENHINERSQLFARGMFEGHRNFLSTRCLLFSDYVGLGSQKYGTIFSKRDDNPNWDTYKRQIPVGINLCASGFPFWGTNIGGYKAIKEDKQRNQSIQKLLIDCDTCMLSTKKMKDYIELYVRWFQFGAFCPYLLSQGIREQNEVWSYGGDAEKILVKYLKIRYRLLPYIYSLAYQSHQNGAPMMRGLFMDFQTDPKVPEITDEYMFGPAFLVAPMVEQGKESREVYLPVGIDWYDYWTYKKLKGGETHSFNAPIDKMPILIKAGSIIPYGPEIEYTTEKLAEPLEIRIYPGADAKFELYEDENDNYNYENGKYSVIPLVWNEKKQTLTIGIRKGEFEGMAQERTFTILFGADYTKAPETVSYSGKPISIKMK